MSNAKKLALLIGDAILLYGALAAALLVRYPFDSFWAHWQDHFWPFTTLFFAWIFVFWLFDLYRQRAFVNYNALIERILSATGIATVVSVVLFYLFQGFFLLTPKTNLVLFAIAVIVLEYIFRSMFLAIARFRPQPAIIIGNSAEVQELMYFLKKHAHAGYEAATWIEKLDAMEIEKLPHLIGGERRAHTIIIQPSLTKDPAAIKALYDLIPLGITIINFTDFYELVFERVPLDELEEGWFIEHVVTRRPVYDRAKRLVDFLLAVFFFVVLLPLSILIMLIVRLTSKGPALFRQRRLGMNDQPFTLYKFRTMHHEAGGAFWTEENDARITAAGKFLRATHLDEIPQLWNIIRGDISFTGPRPERVEITEQYRQLPYYNIRHVVKPGLTGWAQINYKASASLNEGREKLKYDIYYVKNRSFLLDIAIILKTIKYIFTSA